MTGAKTRTYADGASWLLERSGREWLFLDDNARSYSLTSYSTPVTGNRGWLGSNLAEETSFVAAVTSLHTDGRIRQRATKVLAHRPGPLAAAALALRCLDHVSQVREDALPGLLAHASPEDAAAALPVLLAARGRWHTPRMLSDYEAELLARNDPADLLGQLRSSPDRTVRRWAFDTSHSRNLLSSDDLVAIVAREPDQFIRATCAEWLGTVASREQLLRLLAARYGDGRVVALLKLSDEDLGDEALLALLDDPSTRVRDTAQWRARRRGLDVAAAYREWLARPNDRPRRRAAALDGLAAVGGAADAPTVAAFLGDESPSVRACAARALATLGDSLTVRELLAPRLLDPSPRVASAAARGLLRARTGSQDAEVAWVSTQPWSRRAAWMLTRGSGSWERVVADIRAANDDDQTLALLGRAGVRNWLRWAAATTWGRPTSTLLDQLTAGLPGAGLSVAEQREVAFHCGISGFAPQMPAPSASTTAPVEDVLTVEPPRRGLLRLIRRRS